MSAPDFSTIIRQKGFTGAVAWKLDDGTTSAIYSAPAASLSPNVTDNPDYPEVIANTARVVNRVPGVRMETFSMRLLFRADVASSGNWATFLNQVLGPRTNNQSASYIMSIYPSNYDSAITVSGVWFNTVDIMGSFALAGGGSVIILELSGYVLNPDNVTDSDAGIAASSDLAIPSGLSVIGKQISSFPRASFSDGQSSPTVYGGIRSIRHTYTNQLTINPSIVSPTYRLAEGCTPGRLMGGVSVTQLKGSANMTPGTGVNLGFNTVFQTGDGTFATTLAHSIDWNSQAAPVSPSDYNCVTNVYALAGGNSGNGTDAWPVVAAYTSV